MSRQEGGARRQAARPHLRSAGDTECTRVEQRVTTFAVDDAPLLLSQVEAARLLGVTPQTVWRLAKAGRLPRVVLCKRPYYRRADLEEFVQSLPEAEP